MHVVLSCKPLAWLQTVMCCVKLVYQQPIRIGVIVQFPAFDIGWMCQEHLYFSLCTAMLVSARGCTIVASYVSSLCSLFYQIYVPLQRHPPSSVVEVAWCLYLERRFESKTQCQCMPNVHANHEQLVFSRNACQHCISCRGDIVSGIWTYFKQFLYICCSSGKKAGKMFD